MGKIAIITDSNSGITQDEGRKLGISVLPMPFYINDDDVSGRNHSFTGSFL